MAEKLMTPGAPAQNEAPDASPAAQAPRSPAGPRTPGKNGNAPQAAAPAAEGPSQAESGWYMVDEDIEVPRGGGKYMLRKGKPISAKNYDVEQLVNLGAKLRPIAEPSWSRNLRESGQHLAK